jgi:hypothetical protein
MRRRNVRPPSIPPIMGPVLFGDDGEEDKDEDEEVGEEGDEPAEPVTVMSEVAALGSTTSSSNLSMLIWELLRGNRVSGWFWRFMRWIPGVENCLE